jgi:hypothetical protein
MVLKINYIMEADDPKPFVLIVDYKRGDIGSMTYYHEDWKAIYDFCEGSEILGHILCNDGKIITIYARSLIK